MKEFGDALEINKMSQGTSLFVTFLFVFINGILAGIAIASAGK